MRQPPADPPAPPAPKLVSRCSRLPYGVSGWVDLSSCHRYLGFGFVVYQRRFFEINWEKRTVSYYNDCRVDGDFVFGIGKKKEIQMSSIIRLEFPSTQISRRSGVPSSLGPFDIVTPDRIYTLVPLLQLQKNESKEQIKIRNHINHNSSPSTSNNSLFSFSSCCSPPQSIASNPNSNISLPRNRMSSSSTQERNLSLDAITSLNVRDFRQCIIDSSFSNPHDAGGTVANLLLKREVNDGGIPWEFECPITLDVMEDPVIAADGKTYEREAIEDWLLKSGGASIDGTMLPHCNLVPNYRLKEEITAYTKAKKILYESRSNHHHRQKKQGTFSPNKNSTDTLVNWW
mmetsp:Transcript_20772/g.24556  ORF Transcript_20772/g.24556 Transcript_20772/m.24556 type:complete len:344 (+) Transcript_20772:50-1081(+)